MIVPSGARMEAISAASRRSRVRRDVAVVAGVQARRRAVHGQAKAHDAAGTERDPRQAARIDRAVAEEPEIRAQQVAMRGKRLRQIRRARLLFSFEEELELDRAWNLRGGEGIDRRQHRDDGPLVVARGAGVDARLVGERVFRIGPCDRRRAVFHFSGAQDRLEGRRLPRGLGPDRLAVEVRIEKECPPRALASRARRTPRPVRRGFRGCGRRRRAFPASGPGARHCGGCRTRSWRRSAGRGAPAARRRWLPRGRRRRSRRRRPPAPRRRRLASRRTRAKPGQRRSRSAEAMTCMVITPPPIELPMQNRAG